MHGTYLRVVFLLVLVIEVEVTETNTSFLSCSSLSSFRTVPRKLSLPITVVIDGLAYVLLISTVACPAKGISRIDTSNQGAKVLPSFRLAVVPYLLSLNLFVKGFAASGG